MRIVHVKELKRGDSVFCEEDRYVVYRDAVEINGIWTVDTTSSGDYAVDFREGDVLYSRPPVGNMSHGSKIDKPSRFDQE